MTAFNLPLNLDTYSKLLDNYLACRQFIPAFEVLSMMPPSNVALSRFLHACSAAKEMEIAENAWIMMRERNLPPTVAAYNLMIRGYGNKGNLSDALRFKEEMVYKEFKPSEDTYLSLIDGALMVGDMDRCIEILQEATAIGHIMNLHRTRRIIKALCLKRRIDDAFEVFEAAVDVGVDGDLGICADLVDLAKECNSPERVPPVFKCMSRKNIRLDITRAHILISLLSQVDELWDAIEVLNSIPMGSQRASQETYLQLVGTCFRSGLGEDGMTIIKEYLSVAPTNHRPSLEFFNFCLKGYRSLKEPGSASLVMEMIEFEDGIDPDYESYREYICCLLEGRKFKPALHVYGQMIKASFPPDTKLINVYITCFSNSKTLQHHDIAWNMYISDNALNSYIEAGTHLTMFDSCVAHARMNRIMEVGQRMEARHVQMGHKRLEALKRARAILLIVGAGDGNKTATETDKSNTLGSMKGKLNPSPLLRGGSTMSTMSVADPHHKAVASVKGSRPSSRTHAQPSDMSKDSAVASRRGSGSVISEGDDGFSRRESNISAGFSDTESLKEGTGDPPQQSTGSRPGSHSNNTTQPQRSASRTASRSSENATKPKSLSRSASRSSNNSEGAVKVQSLSRTGSRSSDVGGKARGSSENAQSVQPPVPRTGSWSSTGSKKPVQEDEQPEIEGLVPVSEGEKEAEELLETETPETEVLKSVDTE